MRILSALYVCVVCANISNAQIVRIEEDWELRVSHPDQQIDAPQVQTSILPFGENAGLHLQVDINHASYPDFSAGGLQLQLWDGEHCVATKRIKDGIRLGTPNEVISWTSYVQTTSSGLAFGIKDGSSTSFGSFGGNTDYVHVSNGQIGSGSIGNYSYLSSLQNSGVPFSNNRVQHLRLKKIRIIELSGQVTEFPIGLNVD